MHNGRRHTKDGGWNRNSREEQGMDQGHQPMQTRRNFRSNEYERHSAGGADRTRGDARFDREMDPIYSGDLANQHGSSDLDTGSPAYGRERSREGSYGNYSSGQYGSSPSQTRTSGYEQHYGTYDKHYGPVEPTYRGGSISDRLSSGRGSGSSESNERTQGKHYGKGPKGYRRSDERIKEDVCDALMRDHHVDASEIDVLVENGIVTLRGTVEERSAKRLAEDCIEKVDGVKDVHNELRVQSSVDNSKSSTSMGSTGSFSNQGQDQDRKAAKSSSDKKIM